MNHKTKLIYLMLLLTFNFSCVGKKPADKETTGSEQTTDSQIDTLTFTSGIRAIFQDSKGNYWFGSDQEGVARYDGKTFTYFTDRDGLSDNQIHSIQEDQNGLIWFDTQTGVSSYDGSVITDHTKTNQDNAQQRFTLPITESRVNEWMKSERDLWFEAGNQAGVYRYDGQQLRYLAFPPQKVVNTYNNLFAVTDISSGKNNMIWFATYAGVFGYNGSDFNIITDETPGFDKKAEPLHIRSILEDSQGRLWIGNNGLGVLLKDGDSVIRFSEKRHLIHPNSTMNGQKSPPGTLEHVFTIAEDHKGNIWFGDRDAGIWKYDGDTMINYTLQNGLPNDFALSIYTDHQAQLWFGMADGSIYTFDGKNFVKQF